MTKVQRQKLYPSLVYCWMQTVPTTQIPLGVLQRGLRARGELRESPPTYIAVLCSPPRKV